MLGRRERQNGFGCSPLPSQFVFEWRLLREHDRRNRKHRLSGSPARCEHVGLSRDGVYAVDDPAGLLPAGTRWDADLSELVVSRCRAKSLRNSARQLEFQFSTQMDIKPVTLTNKIEGPVGIRTLSTHEFVRRTRNANLQESPRR